MSFPDSWVVFDTETTGFSKYARVLEIGFVYFEMGKPVDTFSSLFNPPDLDWNHPDVLAALKVNGITREDCLGAPTFKDTIEELSEWLSEQVWVGHNISFDVRMLKQEYERLALPWEFKPEVSLCTMNLSYYLEPQATSYKLCDVAPRWGVQPENAHRAHVDALTSGQVLQKMIEQGKLPADRDQMLSLQKESSAAWSTKSKKRGYL